MSTEHAIAEQGIADACVKSDHDAATTLALRAYGPGVLGFLEVRMRDATQAREVFAWFAEDLWRSFATFRGACSAKSWCYALARNAANRYVERELRRHQGDTSLSRLSDESVARVQPITSAPSKLAAEERIASIRAQLSPDEQLLLTLRIDQDMDWKDVAVVMLFDGQPPEVSDISAEAARLRQRFQTLKRKLRELVDATRSVG
jgi:DNA-directed RNA polymerase specialized sigma24 family protein